MARKIKLNVSKRESLMWVAKHIQHGVFSDRMRKATGVKFGEVYDILNDAMCKVVTDDDIVVLKKFGHMGFASCKNIISGKCSNRGDGIRVSLEGKPSTVFSMVVDEYPMECHQEMMHYCSSNLPVRQDNYDRLVILAQEIAEASAKMRADMNEVINAYRTLIYSAGTWEEVVDMWPEVKKYASKVLGTAEAAMFAKTCITVKSEDDLALVLADQKNRGMIPAEEVV